ncbi:MAG: GNAT family N-acetyltransferase [Candidatus Latescibacteria bacterium]|nr:GNAT family N-acetyltransferase [Candidatus Latescibacterota bacterium]NIO27194.1 GNAT family N-acetyltransferase [Candidatus Latescibacterota bacterium]NIO54718.1 GNAT family N-acetyltransferase [Candidatus Latescibacterota bacterium]NIT00801.1 GNAT family N-acetyltransferase [Candidatus Latescibacterota bacterium]NIT37724.1 GNAT family N-acetyltransferase [Candidatus Latescibacterota bacterium]
MTGLLKNVEIVEATMHDLTAVQPLIMELLDAVEQVESVSMECAAENFCQIINDPMHHVMVARVGTSVAGLVNVAIRRTIVHRKLSGLIDELVVSKEYSGRGIGRRLLLEAVNKCREIGCCEVEVSTERRNTRAREFYRNCGFGEDAVLFEMHFEDEDRGYMRR